MAMEGSQTSTGTGVPADAPENCERCPRLVALRQQARDKHPDWHNGPVASFGDPDPRLLIVGMAPGMAGANRTGRPFTGDHAGDLLFATLARAGLAQGTYTRERDDGLSLHGVMITNVVRCVPPQNKPVAAEVNNCRPFLLATLEKHRQCRTYFALGRIAHDAFVRAIGKRCAAFPFGHGRVHDLGNGAHLVDSYHCSRYNTNTGVLTTAMFEEALFTAAKIAQIGRWG